VYIAVSYVYTEQPWEEYRILLFLMVCVTVTLTAQAAGFFIGVIAPLKVSSKKICPDAMIAIQNNGMVLNFL
jgi:hypothetical protein